MKEFPAQVLVLSNISKCALKNEQMNGQMEWVDDRSTDNLSLYFPLSYLSFKMYQAQPKRKMKEREERQQKSQEIKKSARPIYWHMQRLDRHLKE